MKKLLPFLFLFLFSFSIIAQISYENGYFITNSNQKEVCLIKNVDWRSNPVSFEYKLSENGETKIAQISTIQEFGVADLIYMRKTIQIDRSSQRLTELGYNRNPEFNVETIFLKVLVQGNGVLYIYIDQNLECFFYAVNDSNVEQLVYKKYYINNTHINENNLFKQQLLNSLSCKDINKNIIAKVSYGSKDLTKLFINYNSCINPDEDFAQTKEKKDLFNLSIRPGFFTGTFKVLEGRFSTLEPYAADFGSIEGYRLGLETELILPFNKNKWSIIAEPTFSTFNSKVTTTSYYPKNASIDCKTLEIPLGIRHYFFLSPQSKIFANISYVFTIDLNSTLEYERNDGSVKSFDITNSNNMAYGLGFNYIDTYAIEVRYNSNRNLLNSYLAYASDHSSWSLILSYNLF